MLDLLIAGSGPAGLSAAVYASNAMLDFVVVEKYPMSGGQMLNTIDINNYLGFELTDGFTLGQAFRTHAEKAGAKFVNDEIKSIEKLDGGYKVVCNSQDFETKTIIFALGANPRKLSVKGEKEFAGKGVSYCATCDGNFFRGKATAVVGGGDVALEDALYLANICSEVYLIHRRGELRGAKYLQDKVFKNDKIKLVLNSQVEEIFGENKVEGVKLNNGEKLDVDGVFIAVGIEANSTLLDKFVDTDNGFIIADESGRTSAEGIFAAGDVRTKRLRQISTAVSDGANAVHSVEEYLNKN
ncbi:MAG: FAD-dependent oxidoreductase [Ruminococcus sp.]|nr:FAD-dependent oxidoreductase [Ruminococcus sp.]